MKKIALSLILCALLSTPSFAQDAIFEAYEPVEEVQKINLEPDTNAPAEQLQGTVSVKKLSNTVQEENYKKAITNLDDASAEVRQQLINYNSQLAGAKERRDVAKQQVKDLNNYVKQTKKRLKNIEKSKKYINSNFEQMATPNKN